ncbi:M81 family metallopeptidase [Desulfocicer niacini]
MAFRVLSAELSQETNTFNIRPTTIEMWRARRCYQGADEIGVMAGTQSEIGAHIEAAQRYGWSMVQPLAAEATPGGKTSAAAWEFLSTTVLAACDPGSLDGVILALHGAMVTEDQDDAEGNLLMRLREKIGPAVPIAITLDLHGNVSDLMAMHADIILAYRTYPHIDQFQVATQAADLLQQAMVGRIHPHSLVVRGPLLEGCNYGRTEGGPMVRLLEMAAQYTKNEPKILAVSICAGFPWADTPMTGPSVTVTVDGEYPYQRQIAQQLMDEIWAMRKEQTVPIFTLGEVMAAARNLKGDMAGGPLVLADYSDNPGSGGYGDGVRLLEAMIRADLQNACFGCICDPAAVNTCVDAGLGAMVTMDLGAKISPDEYGPPLSVTGKVVHLSDGRYNASGPMSIGVPYSLGPTAVLAIGGVRAIITTNNIQVSDLQVFQKQGIDPVTCSVIALKSWHHFRAAFEPIASRVVLCDSGALVQMDLRRYTYKQVRRPVFPLDLH